MKKKISQSAAYKTALKALARKRRAFDKLSRKEQRITIAQDVIAQIKAKKLLAASTYFGAPNKLCGDRPEDILDLGAAVVCSSTKSDPCWVCGIGSLFISAIIHRDDFDAKLELPFYAPDEDVHVVVLDRDKDQVPYLRRWFDPDQLDLIEDYYEQNGYKCDPSDPFVDSPIYNCDNNNKRLIMIMENIISNGGKFDPTKGKHKNVPTTDD